MRKAFDRQRRLDCPSVAGVPLNFNCRNQTIPILRGLQHIYSRPEVRDSILRAIGRDVNGKSKANRGRPGLDYWEILVLAAARLGCGYDYDQLQDLAENHRALRQVMGIGDWQEEEKDRGKFDWRRIRDNLTLLSPETIEKINQTIIEEGHRLEPKAAETVRADSFVVETNIHYPTDSSLIRDGLRKVLCLAAALAGLFGLDGWRWTKTWRAFSSGRGRSAGPRDGACWEARRFPTRRSCSASSRRTRSCTSAARRASRYSSDVCC